MKKKTTTSGIGRLLNLHQDLSRQAALVDMEDKNEEDLREEATPPEELDTRTPEKQQKKDPSYEERSYEKTSTPEETSYDKTSYDGGSSEKTSYEKTSTPEETSYDKTSYEERSYEKTSTPEETSYDKTSYDRGSSEETSYDKKASPEKTSYEDITYEDPSNFVKLDQIRAYTFTQILPFIFRQTELSAQARIVLCKMVSESIKTKKTTIHVKNNELSKTCGTTYRTAFQVLHDLNEKNWISYIPSKNNRSGSEVSIKETYTRFIEENGIASTCEEIFENLSYEEITYGPYGLVCFVSKDLKPTNILNNKENKESENHQEDRLLFFSQYHALSNVLSYALLKGFEVSRTNKAIIDQIVAEAGKLDDDQTVSNSAEQFQTKLQRAIFYVSTKKAKNKWSYLIRSLENKWYETLSLQELNEMESETALFLKVLTDKFYIDAMGLPELKELDRRLPEVLKGDKITSRSINTARETLKGYFGGISASVEEMLKKWGILSKKASEEL